MTIRDLLTYNPQNTAGAIGFGIDIAVIENTAEKNPNLSDDIVIMMMNRFTTCNRIVVTYGGVDNVYTFESPKETIYNLSVILRWVIDKEVYAAELHENGFSCVDNDGVEFRMKYYD